MPEAVDFPDAERVVIDYLTPLVGVPVSLTVPNPRPGRFLTVQRGGGPRMNLVADNATLVIEAWGNGPSEAKATLDVARRHLNAMRRQTVAGVPVYRVAEATGPAFLPDPDSTQARYTLTVQVAMRGVAA